MLATIHLLVGAAIGRFIDAWPLAFVIAFLTHFLLDALPHTDPGTLKSPAERGSMNMTDLVLAWLDLVVALGVLVWLSQRSMVSPGVLAGVFGGIAPDLPSGIYNAWPKLKTISVVSWYYLFHRRIQGTVDKEQWVRGAVVELLAVVVALAFLLR